MKASTTLLETTDGNSKVRHATEAAKRAAVKLAGDGLLRLPEALAAVGVSKSTWFNGVRTGLYPRPVRIGLRSVAWRSADIRKLVESGVTPANVAA